MDIEAYLVRINYHGSLEPNSQTLRDLQVAHLLTVPFENLDIHLGRPIVLKEEALFDKIVNRRRGGFCYELNGLFAMLLREIGFRVELLSAGMVTPDGDFGPEFDHMTLMVTLEERWLADVGSGESFREPLLLDYNGEQLQHGRAYRIERNGENLFLLHQSDGRWKPRYCFSLTPHKLSDYEEMCHFHQTSPLSHFTQQRVCSLATPEGRITLTDMHLIETGRNGERQERLLETQEEYTLLLREKFGIVIPGRGFNSEQG